MSDLFLVTIGWVHAIAAVTWLGGAIFFWLIMRPAIRSGAMPDSVIRFTGREFTHLVTLSMWVLVVTGGILMFTRLSNAGATLPYGATLGLKVALSAWMFFLVIGRRSRGRKDPSTGRVRGTINAFGHINMTVILGAIIFLLSDILRMLVELELTD